MVGPGGIEPPQPAFQTGTLPTELQPLWVTIVRSGTLFQVPA